jgi:protein-disulfide isomerase
VAPGDLPARGQASASVTWVEFSEFLCPFCAKLHTEAGAQLNANYINNGKVKQYIRDYIIHGEQAMPAQHAARCANEQGKYWEMHDKIFETRDTWAQSADQATLFKGYAADLGLNGETFGTCYDSKKYLSAIQSDMAYGQSVGVSGTPSNFLIIPKNKISDADVKAAVSSINSQYGDGVELFINSDTYVVMIPGAYPYAVFDSILSKVTY